MKRILVASLATLVALSGLGPSASAQQPKPHIGTAPASFDVTDVTGRFSGKQISYRTFYGDRTTICIVAKTINPDVKRLLQEVDRLVDRNAKMGWAAFFVHVGGDNNNLQNLNRELGLKRLPLTLTQQDVPSAEDYTVGTVMSVVMWKQSNVRVNLKFDTVDDQTVGRVLAETKRLH